jgi:hypothetical protein
VTRFFFFHKPKKEKEKETCFLLLCGKISQWPEGGLSSTTTDFQAT